MYFLGLIDFDIGGVGNVISSLEGSEELILIIVLLIVVIIYLIWLIQGRDKSSGVSEQLDSTQTQNQYDLLNNFLSNSAEDRKLFQKSNENFSEALNLLREDRVEVRKWIESHENASLRRSELHESASARRAEFIREIVEARSKEIKELIINKQSGEETIG